MALKHKVTVGELRELLSRYEDNTEVVWVYKNDGVESEAITIREIPDCVNTPTIGVFGAQNLYLNTYALSEYEASEICHHSSRSKKK